MSLKAILLIVLLPLALTGCGLGAADRNAVETLGQMRALSAAISTVSDVDSATRAAPAIETIGKSLTKLSIQRQDLGEVSSGNQKIVDEEIPAARQEVAQKAAILQMSNPQAARIVGEALTRGTNPATLDQPATVYNLPGTVNDLPFLNQPLPAPIQNALKKTGVIH